MSASPDTVLASVARLADRFRSGAAERDRERLLPRAEITELSDAGIYAATVPAEHGGADVPPSVLAEVIRVLAEGILG